MSADRFNAVCKTYHDISSYGSYLVLMLTRGSHAYSYREPTGDDIGEHFATSFSLVCYLKSIASAVLYPTMFPLREVLTCVIPFSGTMMTILIELSFRVNTQPTSSRLVRGHWLYLTTGSVLKRQTLSNPGADILRPDLTPYLRLNC